MSSLLHTDVESDLHCTLQHGLPKVFVFLVYVTKRLGKLDVIARWMADPAVFEFRGSMNGVPDLQTLIRKFSMHWLALRQRNSDPLRRLSTATSSSSKSSGGISSKSAGAMRKRLVELVYAGASLDDIRKADPKYFLANAQRIRDVWNGIKHKMSVATKPCKSISGNMCF